MNHPAILVAGIGNIFLGDDGFGVSVVRQMMPRPQPPEGRISRLAVKSALFRRLERFRRSGGFPAAERQTARITPGDWKVAPPTNQGTPCIHRQPGDAPPPEVRVVDFGIRGLDLAYALLEPYELVVLVDIVQRESKPGTVHVIEWEAGAAALNRRNPDLHGMVPTRAIELARTMGATLPRLVVVGCEPAHFGAPDDGEIALSPAASAAIPVAVAAINRLIAEHITPVPSCTNSA